MAVTLFKSIKKKTGKGKGNTLPKKVMLVFICLKKTLKNPTHAMQYQTRSSEVICNKLTMLLRI
jgi:hypothetical protein